MDRRLSVDLLKILLALMVVGIHANPFKPFGHDAIVLTGQGLYRISVPAFFVINGYFFHDLARAGGTWRYVRRLLILWALWTALYAPAWWGILDAPDPWRPVRILLTGWWHLWYLPGLALAAAAVGLLRNRGTAGLAALMVVTFLAGNAVVYGLAFKWIDLRGSDFGDPTSLHRNWLLLGLPFVLAGFLIRRHDLPARLGLRLSALAAVAGIALVMAESLALDRLAPGGVGHDNLMALGLASPAVVLLALQFTRPSPRRDLGTYANGLFFIHVAFVVIGFRHLDWDSPAVFALAVAGSVAATWALTRTGLARRLL